MKIGVIASIAHRVPSRSPGAFEETASILTEGFLARGHDVTLFASRDSETAGWLHGTVPTGYDDDATADREVCEALHVPAAFELAGQFDVLANHSDFLPLTYSRLVSTPVVTTRYGSSAPKALAVYRRYNDIAHYVAVSDADRHPDLKYAATIHPGIDTSRLTYVDRPGDYLLSLGPIHPDQGAHLAVDVARRAGLPLVIAGDVEDDAYFRAAVRPHVDGTAVSYRGAVAGAERDRLLGGARALLHLINFAEPFGLDVAAALATGTPVVATPMGSMGELVRNGVTGYLVSDGTAAAAAVARLGELDRRACREDADARFGTGRMIEEYLALFAAIVDDRPRNPGSVQGVGSVGLFSHAGMHH